MIDIFLMKLFQFEKFGSKDNFFVPLGHLKNENHFQN